MGKQRNMNLDALRILACIAVVGLHTMRCDVSLANSLLYYLCGFAVPAFFMSSGYILMHREQITGQYLTKKLSSLILVVAAWNYLFYGAKAAAQFALGKADDIRLSELLLSPLMSLIKKGLLYHFWYLGALMLVYIILFLIFKLHLNKKCKQLCLVFVLVSVTIQAISYIHGVPIQKEVIQTFRLWTFMNYFLYGGVLAENKQRFTKGSIKLYAAALALFTALVLAIQIIIPFEDRHAEYFYDDLFIIIWIGLLFVFMMRLKLPERIQNVITALSPLTMGVYIIHIPLLTAVTHFLPGHTFCICLAEWFTILLISFAAAFVISKLPIINRLIKL